MIKKYYSQHLDIKNPFWREKACGIASLLMSMELLKAGKNNLPDLNKLYQVGLNRSSYIKGVGWRHTGLVGLAKIYGFKHSKNFDWFGDKDPILKLKKALQSGPVIASVYSKYEPGRGGHLVVLMSLSTTKAIVLDPDSKTRSEILRELPADKFLKGWKGRVILVRR